MSTAEDRARSERIMKLLRAGGRYPGLGDPYTLCVTCGSRIPRTTPDEGVPMCDCGGRPAVWETPERD